MRGNDGAIIFVCFGVIVGVVIVLLILALLLWLAVLVSNKCLPQPASRYYDDDDDYEYDERDWDQYERPRRRASSRTAIPQPSYGRCVLIEFLNLIIVAIVNFGMRAAAMGAGPGNEGAALGLACCNFIIDFLVLAGMYTALLPTTFPKACLVTVFAIVFRIVLVLMFLVPIFLIAGAAAFR